MKKRTVQFLGLVEVVILLSALILFALQNPNTMTLFLNYTTKHLGLTYDSVSGNLLKTVTVKNVRYKNRILTTEASIDWNIRALLTATLKIDEISVLDLDIPLTETWIADLRKKFGSPEKKRTTIPTIEVSQLVFSAKPFSSKTISVSRIELQANDIVGDLGHVDIGFFSFLIESDYADITALGKIEHAALHIDKLWLEHIDLHKIVGFVRSRVAKPASAATAQKRETLIKSLYIDDLIVYTKPLKYRHYDIKNWSLSLRQLSSADLHTFDAKHVYIDATTNMWTLSSSGKIHANHLYTEAEVSMNDAYFKRFVPFFDFNAIHPIKLYIDADTHRLNGKLYAAAKQLMTPKYKALQLSVPDLRAHVTYDFKTQRMKGKIDARLHSLYTPEVKLDGAIYFDPIRKFHYDGNLTIPEFAALPKPLLPLLQQSDIAFEGDSAGVRAALSGKHLHATYDGANYTDALIRLQTEPLTPALLGITEPEWTKDLRFSLAGDLPIHYRKFLPLHPKFAIQSNLSDINGTATVARAHTTLHAQLKAPEASSLLQKALPGLKTKALFPLQLDMQYAKAHTEIDLKNRLLSTAIRHSFETNETDADLQIEQHRFHLSGDIRNDCNLTTHITSLRELQLSLQKLYRFDRLPMDGDITLDAKIAKLSSIEAAVKGKWFVYEYRPNRFLFAEKITMHAGYADKILTLSDYRFNTYLDRDRAFFAKKPSIAQLEPGRLRVKQFYINDQAQLHGYYDYRHRKGHFFAKARNYHYNDIEGNFYFDTDLEMTLTPDNTDIEGEVAIDHGTFTYEPKKEHNVQDEDIIVIQDQRAKSEENDTLSLDISIVTRKPIYYKIPHTDLKLTLDLKIWKEVRKRLELLGIVRILSGTHTQSGKEFELEPSEILFGGDPLNPYLNINATHRDDPYTIRVNITGQLDTPSINFSATPYLSQSDILSMLLFNTTTDDLLSGSQDSSKTAISLFGNIFAKEIVRNFGIKLDKLVLTTTQEGKLGVEVGKKISKNITLIYINDIVQTIKIRYKLSDHFESDFIFSPENSGADIIYKDEY